MFIYKLYYLVSFIVVIPYCESGFVDTLEKCNHEDSECLKRIVQGTFQNISYVGIPELKIPPFDPLQVTTLKLNFVDMVEMLISEGTLEGLKNCKVDEMKLQIDKGKGTLRLMCSVIGKGKFCITNNGPYINRIFGSNISGEGNAEIKINKLLVRFNFQYDVVRHLDGEIYIECNKDLLKYDYNLLGSSELAMDNVYEKGKDISTFINEEYNKSYKDMWSFLGNTFLEPTKDIAYEIINKFFNNVPVKHYLKGDLTPYIKTHYLEKAMLYSRWFLTKLMFIF